MHVLLAAILSIGCDPAEGSSDRPGTEQGSVGVSGQLGVFYGGQVQELRRVPWPAEGKRPQLGFRLRFEGATPHPASLRWEVDMPSRSAPAGRVQRVSETLVPSGQTVVEQSLDVPPNAELGVWNVRVLVGQQLVIDRALHLYEP